MVVNISAYLRRIDYTGRTEPTLENLRALHRAHMFAVPFENLDIPLHCPIVLDEQRFFHKIVTRRRGGFCYELNGLFAALLRELGYTVTLLSARVAKEAGGFGEDFDHLTLRVDVGGPWLADVGFGDCFLEPLPLDPDSEHAQGGFVYKLDIQINGDILLSRREQGGDTWKPEYRFGLVPRELSDFSGMCHYHQTSPESGFTKKRVCSRATPDGRVTLSGLKLIVTSNGQRVERELRDEAEFEAVLRREFGIELSVGSVAA